MRLVVQQEGARGLYKGLSASFLGLSHVAVQFPLYEALKETFHSAAADSESSATVLVASTSSKLVASTLTYPHEVVRAQMQARHTRSLAPHFSHTHPPHPISALFPLACAGPALAQRLGEPARDAEAHFEIERSGRTVPGPGRQSRPSRPVDRSDVCDVRAAQQLSHGPLTTGGPLERHSERTTVAACRSTGASEAAVARPQQPTDAHPGSSSKIGTIC